MEKQQTKIKLKGFMIEKIQQCDHNYQQSTDLLDKLHWASVRKTYAEMMGNFLNDQSFLIKSQLLQTETYLQAKCYDQALTEARLMLEFNGNIDPQVKEKLNLSILRCMVEKGRYLDAKQIVSEQTPSSFIKPESEETYYDLIVDIMLNINDKEATQQNLDRLSQILTKNHGDRSIEYGMFLVKKGKAEGYFEDYEQAVKSIEGGIEIMIEKKWKNKEKIAEIYLLIATFYNRSLNWDKQYTSLICAQAMIRQLPENQKNLIKVIHKLSANLERKQEPEKAIKELKRVEVMEKQIYGQSSVQVGKTIKQIIKLLNECSEFKEAKVYEQEYRRIMGILGEDKGLKDITITINN